MLAKLTASFLAHQINNGLHSTVDLAEVRKCKKCCKVINATSLLSILEISSFLYFCGMFVVFYLNMYTKYIPPKNGTL